MIGAHVLDDRPLRRDLARVIASFLLAPGGPRLCRAVGPNPDDPLRLEQRPIGSYSRTGQCLGLRGTKCKGR